MTTSSRPLLILVYPKIDHEKDYVYFWAPFSLLTIAKPLIDDGLADVVIFDGNQSSEADWERFLDIHLPRAICVGISIMTGGGQISHALKLVEALKRRDSRKPVVFGGPHVNVLGEQTASHHLVDAVLVGPGQNSLPSFVNALSGLIRFEDVPGLIMRTNETFIRGPQNLPQMKCMGRYPWQLIPVESYVRNDPCVAQRSLNYVSSQGCVYKCRFCYELIYQSKYSAIAAVDLLNDVEDLRQRYGINGIKFYDADWFINLRRSAEFARGLIDRSIDIKWAASINPKDVLRARKVQPNLLPLIAASGCSRLLMGIESGSNRVLRDVIRKEISRDEIMDVAIEIARNGILGSYTFIIGFPGEMADERAETYALIDELRMLSPQPETRIHLFAPYPGTPLYQDALDFGFSPPENLEAWSAYDYYDSQTPWTDAEMVRTARALTAMRKPDTSLKVVKP